MKCDKCDVEMDKVGVVRDHDTTGEYGDYVYVFYQCPICKTIKIDEAFIV